MEAQTVRIAVQHGVILVGSRRGVPPERFDGKPVAATDSVVAVTTLHEVDGETLIRLAGPDQPERPLGVRAFHGSLSVPDGKVCVCTTTDEVLLEATASTASPLVTVWTNDDNSPSEVVVAVH